MHENNDQRKGLSSVERQQIGYLLRFLALILVCVLFASLAAGLVVTLLQ